MPNAMHAIAVQQFITVNGGMRMNCWFDIASKEDINHAEDLQRLRHTAQLVDSC